jgi:hypothetical protein
MSDAKMVSRDKGGQGVYRQGAYILVFSWHEKEDDYIET